MLSNSGTRDAAGKLLKAIFPLLSAQERENIERTLLSLPQDVPVSLREDAQRLRLRHVGCLDSSDIVLEETHQIMAEQEKVLSTARSFLANLQPITKAHDTDELDAGLNLLIQPLVNLSEKHVHNIVTLAEVEQVQPAIAALLQFLNTTTNVEEPSISLGLAWGYLARACTVASRLESLDGSTVSGVTVREALLAASSCSAPVHNADQDADFAKGPSWNWPAPRLDATIGLMFLTSKPSCVNQEVLSAVERLSQDFVASVRYQVASRLNFLFHSSPALDVGIVREVFERRE